MMDKNTVNLVVNSFYMDKKQILILEGCKTIFYRK